MELVLRKIKQTGENYHHQPVFIAMEEPANCGERGGETRDLCHAIFPLAKKFCVMSKKNEVKAPVLVKRRQQTWGKTLTKIEMQTEDRG